jgi:hypothetical protein
VAWARSPFAQATADALTAGLAAYPLTPAPSVFAAPPLTLNPPALVVGRPTEVIYSTAGFWIDIATVSIVCLGALQGEDTIDALITYARGVVAADPRLAGVVQSVTASREQSWREVSIGGADFLAADLVLTVQM